MKTFVTSLIIVSSFALIGCGSSKPLSESEQAASYGMTVERYREEKSAAARMGMNFEAHIKMLQDDSM